MIRLSKETLDPLLKALIAESIPAYFNWKDPAYLATYTDEYIVLYSGELILNYLFIKEEFYLIKRDGDNIEYSIILHHPISSLAKQMLSDVYEFTILKNPVLEPSNIGELLFQKQYSKLDGKNHISLIEFLDLNIPNKIKDIFLFKINEFSKNGE